MAPLSEYIRLIESFYTGCISASDFEKKYLELFKNDGEAKPEKIFNILDKLFSDVDAFCADPYIRDENDIDEEELRICCQQALNNLKG